MPCTTILVGSKASYDGSTMIARTDDGGFDVKKLTLVKPSQQKRKYKSVIGHLEIELPDNPLPYTACPNVDLKDGLWAATGINAENVGMTATETITTNARVLGADPLVRYKKAEKRGEKDVPGGIGEEDLVVLVLPYIRSAREGVERLGALLEQYGTYESNGIAFNDANEVWWLETIGGHHWIAKRVPDEAVVIMPNQFGMDEFDFTKANKPGSAYMCSGDLEEFARKNALILNPLEEKIDIRAAFGSHSDADHIYNTPRAWFMGRYLCPEQYKWDGENADFTPTSDRIPWCLAPSRRVTVEDVKYLLSSHYQGTPYDPLRKGRRPAPSSLPPDRQKQHGRDDGKPDPRLSAKGDPGGGVAVLLLHHLRRAYAPLHPDRRGARLLRARVPERLHRCLLLVQPHAGRAGRPALRALRHPHRALSEPNGRRGPQAAERVGRKVSFRPPKL